MIMKKVTELENVESHITDSVTDLIRSAAKAAIRSAVEEELVEFLKSFKNCKLDNGKQQIVRNGHHPERKISTGVGTVGVKVPRVRDRGHNSDVNFKSDLIPPYMRRTATLDVLIPLMYLKGISTNDFQSTLAPILGDAAKNVSPSVIAKLKQSWSDELDEWRKRDLSGKQYVYWWVDGVYLSARMESEKTCILVIVGATKDGKKELIAFNDGFRESTDSWLELLRDIKNRGLSGSPFLAIGDGALGFWSALEKEHPNTKQQRCWVHKTANILSKLPKSQQIHAKSKLKEIYMAANKKDAETAFDDFINTYENRYPKATNCLAKDRDHLLNFYDFPAEHWRHIRTTNPIESTFATVKHRTRQSRGCFSRETILAAFFKLMMEAEKRWHRLHGSKRLAEVVEMVQFVDGISEHEVDKLKEEKENAA